MKNKKLAFLLANMGIVIASQSSLASGKSESDSQGTGFSKTVRKIFQDLQVTPKNNNHIGQCKTVAYGTLLAAQTLLVVECFIFGYFSVSIASKKLFVIRDLLLIKRNKGN